AGQPRGALRAARPPARAGARGRPGRPHRFPGRLFAQPETAAAPQGARQPGLRNDPVKIRAAVLNAMGAPTPYADSRPLVIEELELAPPGPGEVLVRIKAAGLCHSDLSVINKDRQRPMPMALRHEAS